MKDKRTFDWGPPPQKTEGLKEILMYFCIGLFFFGGIYLLLDTKNKPEYVAVEEKEENMATKENELSRNQMVYSKEIKKHNSIRNKPELDTSRSQMIEPPAVEISYGSGSNYNSAVEIAPKPRFYVQMGAFENENAAKEICNLLRQTGSEPLLKSPDNQNEAYRVLIGPFDSEADADYKAEKLNELDLPCFVVEQ